MSGNLNFGATLMFCLAVFFSTVMLAQNVKNINGKYCDMERTCLQFEASGKFKGKILGCRSKGKWHFANDSTLTIVVTDSGMTDSSQYFLKGDMLYPLYLTLEGRSIDQKKVLKRVIEDRPKR